jgi:lipoic acid synthetase
MAIRQELPQATIEALTSDFAGCAEALHAVLAAGPDVFNHNVETVPRLYEIVRPQADYARSLDVLRQAAAFGGVAWVSRLCVAARTGSGRGADPQANRDGPHGQGPRAAGMLTKSGLMVGLGETDDEVVAVLRDLRGVGCQLVTIGQYLSPSPKHLPVERYVEPAQFERWRSQAMEMGFKAVMAGPFVRSSYHAADMIAGP